MDTEIIRLTTGEGRGVFNITEETARFAASRGSGLLNVFAPHATVGVAIIETGAGTDADLVDRLDAILPRDDSLYSHRHGSAGHGADHVLPALVAPSITVPVIDGRLALGRWQSIVLVDPNADNPRRNVRLTFLAG